MDAIETEILLDDVASVVKLAIERSVDPILARLAALEKQLAILPAPKEIDAEAIVTLAVKAIAPEIAGMRADIDAVAEKAASAAALNVPDIIAETVKAFPAPVATKGVSIEDVRQIAINEMAGLKTLVEELQPAPMLPDIGKMVEDAVASRIPENIDERIETAARKVFDGMELPLDGVGLTGALIDKAGHLVLTLSSGEVKDVGPVCGKDGASIDSAAVQKQIAEMFEAIPKPKNGDSVTLADVLPVIEASIAEKFKSLPEPKNGESVTVEDVRPLIEAEVAKRVNEIPKPEDGKSIDPADVMQMVKDAVDEIPRPENGKDADPEIIERMVRDAVAAIPPAELGKDADPELIKQMLAEAVAQIPPPLDGKDVDMAVVEAKLADAIESTQARVSEAIAAIPDVRDGVGIAEANINGEKNLIITLTSGEVINAGVTCWDGADVDMKEVMLRVNEALAETTSECLRLYAEWIAAIPLPKNGDSVTIDDVRPLIVDEVRSAVEALPKAEPGKDGADVIECFIDNNGQLVVTLSNGKIKTVGKVVGRDGDNVDMNEVISGIQKMVAELPKPKDGQDGLGFDDLSLEYDGEKTVTLRFAKGDRSKEIKMVMPIVIDRGVYREGHEYKAGDGCTWGGSYWIAQEDTTEKPETGKGWRLAVKKGRPGKDAGEPPKSGPVKL